MQGLQRKIFWAIIALGLALPWLVGIAVKLYLQAQGKPTLPWSYFLDPLALLVLVPFAVWFASPYIGLAFLARHMLATPSFFHTGYAERLIIILAGLIWGAVGTVKTFIDVFWEFDPLFFFVPLPAFYVDDIVIGLLGGSVLASVSILFRWLTTPPKI